MDELQGIVKGLVDVAQGQIKAKKELSENTLHQLDTLRAQLLTSTPRFHWCWITLPTYAGTPAESLDPFHRELTQNTGSPI